MAAAADITIGVIGATLALVGLAADSIPAIDPQGPSVRIKAGTTLKTDTSASLVSKYRFLARSPTDGPVERHH